jgi:hypothetical protein
MPRQNRVTPTGDLVAVPDRGTLMGNRGVLHDADGHVRRAWQSRRWIVCVLEFKGRRRPVMAPGRYTELFFLDEATALAAGHRPCAECRRERFNAFRAAWRAAVPEAGPSPPTADAMDRRLHAERVGPGRVKRLFAARLGDVPDGAFVRHVDRGDDVWLVRHGGLLAWSPGGYTRRIDRPPDTEVAVVTPASTAAALRGGYVPAVHPSAAALA